MGDSYGHHLKQNGQSLLEASELLVGDILHQLLPILTPKQGRTASDFEPAAFFAPSQCQR
jgi:hypothetical protein